MPLRINGVDCAYDHIAVLAGVTLEVEEGEFLGVIGPNGSGKTTLLRAINGTLKPRIGTVMLDAKSVANLKPREMARLVGSVPQRSSIPFDFTAREIVLMGRISHQDRIYGETKRDSEAVSRAMELTRSSHLRNRPYATLSGGEQQRVLIARALSQEPRILLLDEPTSHLDLGGQIGILSLTRRICAEESLIVIAVLHDLNLAARFSNRLVLMNKGRIEGLGAPEAVLQPEVLERVYHCQVRIARLPGIPHLIVIPREADT